MNTRRNRRKPYVSQYRREQAQDGIFMWALAALFAVGLFAPVFF